MSEKGERQRKRKQVDWVGREQEAPGGRQVRPGAVRSVWILCVAPSKLTVK